MDISAILSNMSNIVQEKQTKQVKETGFNNVLNQCTETDNLSAETMIEKLFTGMNVSVKTGSCNVAKKNWERNDFPFWNYFNENTTAESLNNWKTSEYEPAMADSKVQAALSKLEFGTMAVIIPESVCEKMEESSIYADKILKKLSDWKSNYDTMDNGLAATYGSNVAIYQYSKSYCLELDENGDVENYTVVSGGLDDQTPDNSVAYTKREFENIKSENSIKRIIKKLVDYDNIILQSENQDYISNMEVVATSIQKRKSGNT